MATNKVIIDVKTKGTKKATSNLGGVSKKIAGIGMAYFGATGLINGIKSLILVPIAIPLFSTKIILKYSQSKIGEIPYPDKGKFNLIYIFVI